MNNNLFKCKINAKLLKEKLKEGWGPIDFANHLGISEKEFWTSFNKTFKGRAADNLRRGLESNDRTNKKASRRRKPIKLSPENGNQRREEEIAKRKMTNSSDEETITILESSELEKALSREKKLTDSLMSLENDHKTELVKRRILVGKVIQLKDKLLHLKEDIIECSKKAVNLLAEGVQIENNLERINKEKAEVKTSLDEVREKIADLKKVQINIIDDIEIIPAEEYTISDEWKDLRNSWLDDERFSILTVIEISLLAKAIVLRESMQKDGRRFEFVFVSDDMERLFNEIS